MKILFLTKYSRKGASSRLRSFQYIPYLEKAGWDVSIAPLFNDNYLKNLYSGKKNFFGILLLYLKRFIKLFSIRKFDAVFIEYELFPYLPAWGEKIISRTKIKFLVDYDDAVFHNYDKNENYIIRSLLRNKIDHVMKSSTCVIAGNHYLASRSKLAGSRCTEILPTVIDLDRYFLERRKNTSEILVIGWIGSPSTFKYLYNIKQVLKYVVENYNVELHIIGAKGDLGFSKNIHFIEWSESTEVQNISKFDIGIMPLEHSPWEKGKCGYKLIQYMGCRLPVIASPVGVNKKLVEEGLNGFLPESDEEWIESFKKYIESPALAIRHGNVGYEKVRKKYCLQVTQNKFMEILKR